MCTKRGEYAADVGYWQCLLHGERLLKRRSINDRLWHGVLSQLCELLAEKPLLAASVLGRNSPKSFWVSFSNCYQCFGRTARLPTTLFPILQGAH